jgi:molecular chaperone GrpE
MTMAQEAISAAPDEIHNKYLRALADLENLRKKKNEQVEAAELRGETSVASRFLPLIDEFHRTMKSMSNDDIQLEDLREGVMHVFGAFQKVLQDLQIEGFESEGREFAYEFMEAIAEIPTSNALPGTVVEELARGYTRGGKVIRHARVAVAVESKE